MKNRILYIALFVSIPILGLSQSGHPFLCKYDLTGKLLYNKVFEGIEGNGVNFNLNKRLLFVATKSCWLGVNMNTLEYSPLDSSTLKAADSLKSFQYTTSVTTKDQGLASPFVYYKEFSLFNQSIQGYGNGDCGLSKYYKNGNTYQLEWVQTWGGLGDDYANSVAYDDSGFIWVTGFAGSDCFFNKEPSVKYTKPIANIVPINNNLYSSNGIIYLPPMENEEVFKSLSIFDLSGKRIYQTTQLSGNTVDAKEALLAYGIYVVDFKTNKRTISKKILIE